MARLTFPPVNSGGLIEADDVDTGVTAPNARFPPVNSGGLIEASNLLSDRELVFQCFRR